MISVMHALRKVPVIKSVLPLSPFEKEQAFKKLLSDGTENLSWVVKDFEVERLCDFFNYSEILEKNLVSCSDEMCKDNDELRKFFANVGRDPYGWFRAEAPHPATPVNTFVGTGYLSGDFNTLSVEKISRINDQPSFQGGWAKSKMDTKTFYLKAFVYPYVRSNYKLLQAALAGEE